MFHIAGMNSQIVMAPVTGMTIVYPPQGRWQESVHLQLSQEHQVTNWSLVPAQLWRLVDWPDLQKYDLSSLRNIGGGSSIWPPELLRRAREVLPGAKAEIRLGYGMTETNGLGTSLGPPLTYSHPESVGRPSAAVEVEVRDPATGEAVGEGVTGEVCLRTAASLICYWDNPEATASALDEQRWYRTGDFGYIREGLLFLEGRRHDLIIRGGENIYPAEIENRLVEHPDIAEVAVVGVDHPTLGQEVKAFIVPARDRTLTRAGSSGLGGGGAGVVQGADARSIHAVAAAQRDGQGAARAIARSCGDRNLRRGVISPGRAVATRAHPMAYD